MTTTDSENKGVVVPHRPPELRSRRTILDLVRHVPSPPLHVWGACKRQAVTMELVVATISHAINEDVLVECLTRQVAATPSRFTTSSLSALKSDEVVGWFERSSEAINKGAATDLAALIRRVFLHVAQDGFAPLVHVTQTGSAVSLKRALRWFGTCPVFKDDSLQKKAVLVLQRLYLGGYVQRGALSTHLPLAIDRHLVRLALRLGLVEVTGADLRTKVRTRGLLSQQEDTVLRTAVREALESLVRDCGADRPSFNYALWQLARRDCRRTDPHCAADSISNVDGRRQQQLERPRSCPLSTMCRSYKHSSMNTLLDPLAPGGLY